ncbi:MAG: hypothetical protein IV097_12170 [Burkholderiaceae bacterium]|nr:hypothetical protein [Burkholderiaceae bacterium]
MADAFSDFLATPSGETFLRLREDVLASPAYDFQSDELESLSELVEAGQFDAAADQFSALMPAWLLSPRAHLLAGRAAAQSGDADRAQLERDFAQACLRGLRQSGDGSAARPYRVSHVADEYDLLESLGRSFASQRQVSASEGVFDLITCTDGSELWFEIPIASAPPR